MQQLAIVIEYPSNAKTVIEQAISVFLSIGKESYRDWLHTTIKKEMDRHGFTHCHCNGFEVFKTSNGILFDTSIKGVKNRCPKCGQSFEKSKLLTVYEGWKHERHVYGCPGKCGQVYTITWRKGDIYDIP